MLTTTASPFASVVIVKCVALKEHFFTKESVSPSHHCTQENYFEVYLSQSAVFSTFLSHFFLLELRTLVYG